MYKIESSIIVLRHFQYQDVHLALNCPLTPPYPRTRRILVPFVHKGPHPFGWMLYGCLMVVNMLDFHWRELFPPHPAFTSLAFLVTQTNRNSLGTKADRLKTLPRSREFLRLIPISGMHMPFQNAINSHPLLLCNSIELYFI